MTSRNSTQTKRRTKRVYTRPPAVEPFADRRHAVAAAAALVIGATLAAALERVWFPVAWGEAASLTSAFYYGDATRFVDYAFAIARGQLYDNGIPYHPPGWPLALSAVLRWSGAAAGGPIPVATIKVLAAVLSAVSVGLSALVAGELAGFGALAAVVLLGPFDFGHIVEGTVANSEALYGLLVILATWTAWRWLRDDARRPLAWAAAAALTGGAAAVVRAEFLAAAVLTAAAAWLLRRRAIDVVVYGGLLCAALAPTTVWHWRTLSAFNATHVGRVAGPLPVFAPVTSYGPFNFAMANHEDADGGPNRDHPMLERCSEDAGTRLEAGQLDLACPAIYELYVGGYTIGAQWLLRHPGAAIALAGRKGAMTIGFLGEGFLADGYGAGVDGVRRRVDLVDPVRRWLIPIRMSLIVAGLIALRPRRVALAVLVPPLVAFAASSLLFYGYVRLGIAYLPIVWVLEGAGVSAMAFLAFRRRADARAALVVGVALLALVVYERSARDISRHLEVDGVRAPDGSLIQDETMELRRP